MLCVRAPCCASPPGLGVLSLRCPACAPGAQAHPGFRRWHRGISGGRGGGRWGVGGGPTPGGHTAAGAGLRSAPRQACRDCIPVVLLLSSGPTPTLTTRPLPELSWGCQRPGARPGPPASLSTSFPGTARPLHPAEPTLWAPADAGLDYRCPVTGTRAPGSAVSPSAVRMAAGSRGPGLGGRQEVHGPSGARDSACGPQWLSMGTPRRSLGRDLTARVEERLGLHHPLLACHLLQAASRPALPLSLGHAGAGWCPALAKRLSSGRPGSEAPQLDCRPASPVPGGSQTGAAWPSRSPTPGVEVGRWRGSERPSAERHHLLWG